MKAKKQNGVVKHTGSTFDSYLEEEGLREEVEAVAIERVHQQRQMNAAPAETARGAALKKEAAAELQKLLHAGIAQMPETEQKKRWRNAKKDISRYLSKRSTSR